MSVTFLQLQINKKNFFFPIFQLADLPASSTYSGALSYHFPQAGLIRRSLPNMAHSILVHEPAKIYPYHLLIITNYRLPGDVDRCNLEVRVYLMTLLLNLF